MDVRFSDKVSALKPSAIREIFKVLSIPGMISFAGGNPSPEAFPKAEMAEISERIFRESPDSALQYGITEGYDPLRRLTAERLRSRHKSGGCDDSVIITSGGQQAIELFAKVMLNEGDAVLCENPSFIGALNAFRSYGANLVGIPMDEEGMSASFLEDALKTQKNVRFIYVIPTFQNPSGRTMSLSRRREILALAEKHRVLILEDSPYLELRYSGEEVPTIKSLDVSGRVVYAGSYSKILSPGIRLGFCCADSEITEKIVVAKQVSDVHTNQFFMMLAAGFLQRYDIDVHIEKIRLLYTKKRDLMLSCLEKAFCGRVSFARPDGGLFLWCEMPPGHDGDELCRLGRERMVAAVPGSSFMVSPGVCPSFRMNFSMPSDDDIVRGTEILGEVMNAYLSRR